MYAKKRPAYMGKETYIRVKETTKHVKETHIHAEETYTFIGKVAFICLRVSVHLVYKFQGKPGTTTVKHDFNPNGLKFHRGSP